MRCLRWRFPVPRKTRPTGHPQRGGGSKRGRHKKASSKDMRRRIREWERMDWRRLNEGKAA